MQITIIGLTMLGTSLALALKGAHEAISITGHDPDPDRAADAKHLGAIDRSAWNLPAACEKSGLIVLDLPLNELRRTLAAIGESAAPDTVIVDLAPVKRPVLEYVRASLPHPERFVGGHLLRAPRAPIAGEPSAEQVRGATFYLVASAGTSAEALDVASNLAVAAGAEPRYIDAAEHDGLTAATCQLPVMAAAGVVGALSTDAGGQERQGSSGSALAALRLALGDGVDPAALLGNGDNLLYWIDRYVVELQRLRRLVAEGDEEALAKALAGAVEAATRWGEGGGDVEPPPGRGAGGLRELFLGGLGRGRPSG